MKRRTVTLERTFQATLQEVWDLWTTKDGVESWWGPDGFEVRVKELDLRPGGRMVYLMCAMGKNEIAAVESIGLSREHEASLVYDEIVPPRRLRYTNQVSFIPGVDTYDAGTLVELTAKGGSVRMLLTLEAMHSDEWTNMAVSGWESELGKLERRLARH